MLLWADQADERRDLTVAAENAKPALYQHRVQMPRGAVVSAVAAKDFRTAIKNWCEALARWRHGDALAQRALHACPADGALKCWNV